MKTEDRGPKTEDRGLSRQLEISNERREIQPASLAVIARSVMRSPARRVASRKRSHRASVALANASPSVPGPRSPVSKRRNRSHPAKRAWPVLALGLALAISGCIPDSASDFDFKSLQPPAPPPELTGDVLVGTESAGPLTVELYADRGGAHLGMNVLSARLASDGVQQAEARITWTATPTVGPAAGVELTTVDPPTQADDNGFFRGEAFLLTPDTTARSFEITAQITPLNGSTQEATFTVEARNDIWMQTSDDLLISWVSPARPVVGANTFEVAAHRWTGTAFETVDGATPSLAPYMDMGGGDGHSTPFTKPAGVGDGRYRSTVDFIMSGGWEMGVSLAHPDQPTDTIRFVGYTVYEP